jgi:hypothetical protein
MVWITIIDSNRRDDRGLRSESDMTNYRIDAVLDGIVARKSTAPRG